MLFATVLWDYWKKSVPMIFVFRIVWNFFQLIIFLSDIDDDEIDTYILTKKEAAIKERFWMRCNGEHLKEMDRR